MPKYENEGSETSSARPKKKSSGGGANVLRSVVAGAGGTDGLIELIERFGLVDMVMDRIKQRVDELDMDELFDDVRDYLKRNPEVLVVALGSLTIATGVIVYLNARREWDGNERRRLEAEAAATKPSGGQSRKGQSRR